MSLNVKYHYTHFIYPFIVQKGKYYGFIQNILKQDKNWKLKIHEEKEDEESYNFFLPYMRKFLFPTMFWNDRFIKQYKGYSITKRASLLKKASCITFELNLDSIKSGSVSRKKYGVIDFNIVSLKLICFEPGICFIDIKTEIEDTDFDKVLDFNAAFRELMNKKNFDIKAKSIDNVNDISLFIKSIVSGYECKELNKKYYDKMFTYSYVCIDKENWNKPEDFENLKNDFYKFQYVMDSKNSAIFNTNYDKLKNNSYSRWLFSEFGFSKESGVVFVSDSEKYNITKMPYNFEKKYLYMLLLAFYQRISLINFSQDLMKHSKDTIKLLKRRLTKFTHLSWFSQISNSENGMDIWKKWQESFELKELYDEVHKEYIEYYDFIATSGQDKINVLLIFLYTMSVIFAGFSIIVPMFKVTKPWFEPTIIALIILTALSYPIYMIIKVIKHKLEKKFGDY